MLVIADQRRQAGQLALRIRSSAALEDVAQVVVTVLGPCGLGAHRQAGNDQTQGCNFAAGSILSLYPGALSSQGDIGDGPQSSNQGGMSEFIWVRQHRGGGVP